MPKKSRLRALLPYAYRQWRYLLGILALTLASSAAAACQPWPMKLLVDYALAKAPLPSHLSVAIERLGFQATPNVLIIIAAFTTILLFFLNSAIGVGLSICWSMSGQRMVYELASDLFARLQRLSLLFHSRREVGDSLSRLTEDTWCLYSVMDGLLIAPIQQLLTLATMLCIAFVLDPVLATLALCITPFMGFASRYFGKRLKHRSKIGREAKSRLVSFTQQTLSAIPLIQVFGTEERNTKRFRLLADEATSLAQKGNLVGSSYGLISGLITTVGMAVVLYVGSLRVLSGAIPLGTLLVFLAYLRQMQGATGGLFKVFTKLKAAEASIDRVMEVMESQEEVRELPNARPLRSVAESRRGHVVIEEVTFGYEPDRAVIRNVSLEALPGETIALVGPTGAGKSTLASLILRFCDPWNGRVLFDGVDIRNVSLASLRCEIGMVLQEPFLLPMSIADNIAYGRPNAERSEIIEAAIAARADAFIRRLPQGYDTMIGERGASLSGGERQRLSIARALLRNATVLILDEPTAALDIHTESSVMEAFQNLMAGRTTFIIAHRLSTIRRADRIAVLDGGCLVELGDHEQLMEAKGLYHRMYSRQCTENWKKVVA